MKGINEAWMRRCLQIAELGTGNVAPNPMVGCVIVHDGKITGEGYHREFGGPHAEVFAVESVKEKDTLSSSTLYVNLEPCAHHGKTPPCADLIIRSGIRKVVVGCLDVCPAVSGSGIRALREAGTEVVVGILETASRELNRRFFSFHIKKRPYIILKWAQTLDGFIDVVRGDRQEKRPTWITPENLMPLVHKCRTEEAAIMVGTRTALMDNPMLTAREWPGKNPCRIVIDKELKLPRELALFDGTAPTLVLTARKAEKANDVEYITLDFSIDILPQLMKVLYERNLQSLIVEGGAALLESFISAGLWDEAKVFTGNMHFGKGVKAPSFPFIPKETHCYGDNRLSYFRNI